MAVELELLLPYTSTDQFAIDEATGVYVVFIPEAPCVLEMGCTYTVYWDGVKYEGLVAQDVSAAAQVSNSVAIGNITPMGGTGNNEPFAVLYMGGANAACLYSITDGEHAITIYKEVEQNTDIVLKSYEGEDMIFSGVEKVALENTEDEDIIFSKGEALDNVDVELNFANGNQVVEAPRGCFVKKATIAKPDNLVPEHIAEGINIAGIIGTFVGGANVKIASGTFSGNNGTVEVTHNLGATPDFIIAWVNTYSSVSSISGKSAIFFSMSKELKTLSNLNYVSIGVLPSSSSAIKYDGTSSALGSCARLFPLVTETLFRVGSEWVPTASGKTYNWLAISSLT